MTLRRRAPERQDALRCRRGLENDVTPLTFDATVPRSFHAIGVSYWAPAKPFPSPGLSRRRGPSRCIRKPLWLEPPPNEYGKPPEEPLPIGAQKTRYPLRNRDVDNRFPCVVIAQREAILSRQPLRVPRASMSRLAYHMRQVWERCPKTTSWVGRSRPLGSPGILRLSQTHGH